MAIPYLAKVAGAFGAGYASGIMDANGVPGDLLIAGAIPVLDIPMGWKGRVQSSLNAAYQTANTAEKLTGQYKNAALPAAGLTTIIQDGLLFGAAAVGRTMGRTSAM
jgi:hypothetical protein